MGQGALTSMPTLSPYSIMDGLIKMGGSCPSAERLATKRSRVPAARILAVLSSNSSREWLLSAFSQIERTAEEFGLNLAFEVTQPSSSTCTGI